MGRCKIALLVTFARQTLKVEEWTPAAEIRNVAKSYNKYSEKHFGETLVSVGDVFHIRGTGAGRSMKLKQTGVEKARELIAGLADGRE